MNTCLLKALISNDTPGRGKGHEPADSQFSTYWNQGYGYQQGYGPRHGGSDDSPHGYYGYGPGYYYSHPYAKTYVQVEKANGVGEPYALLFALFLQVFRTPGTGGLLLMGFLFSSASG
ncbi:hypothetical protein MUG91_G334n4 [Manis pentadactyla]|nr:hypothetical protein MUG91_G334n4 [Manis pentadactyla]